MAMFPAANRRPLYIHRGFLRQLLRFTSNMTVVIIQIFVWSFHCRLDLGNVAPASIHQHSRKSMNSDEE